MSKRTYYQVLEIDKIVIPKKITGTCRKLVSKYCPNNRVFGNRVAILNLIEVIAYQKRIKKF